MVDYSKFSVIDELTDPAEEPPPEAASELRDLDDLPAELTREQALVFAASGGAAEVVKQLLAEAVDANAVDTAGWTALARAVYGKEPWEKRATIEALLAARADVNIGRESSVQVAAKHAPYELVELLGAAAAPAVLAEALVAAAAAGNRGATRSLLERRAATTSNDEAGMSALHHWTGNGDHEEVVRIVQALIAGSANVNCTSMGGKTPLHIAAVKGHGRLAGVLLGARAKPDASDMNGRTPLEYAAAKGDAEMEEHLLSGGAKSGPASLVAACLNARTSAAKALLAAAADVNAADARGRVPLVAALLAGAVETSKVLLDAKADVNLRGTSGQAGSTGVLPIHLAVVHNILVEDVIARSADLNACDERGFPPLLVTVRQRATTTLKLLLTAKADVSVKHAQSGKTALILAAGVGDRDGVDALLAAKGDPRVREPHGLQANALGAAAANGHLAVCAKLELVVDPDDAEGGPSARALAQRMGHAVEWAADAPAAVPVKE